MILFLILILLVGCSPLSEVNEFSPLPGGDWGISTPEEVGLDPKSVEKLYNEAAKMESLYGLVVIKNGQLIAEGYFNEGSIDQKYYMASATKSFTSALVGIALDQGCLTTVDQRLLEFFPEFIDQIDDPRKELITIRDLLQMRSGYVWEERTPYMESLFRSQGYWLPFISEFPLTNDPGSEYGYSNLSSHLLGVIVARACNTDLKSFAEEHLFSPLNAEVGEWLIDSDDYYYGAHGLSLSARDRAKFGLLYINEGDYEGIQIIPEDWIEKSLVRYSEGINLSGWIPGITNSVGNFRDLGYGYQWWSARAGRHEFYYAAGHGGNLIVLLEDLDMVIVTTSDPLHFQFGGEAWEKEKAIINLVGRYIKSLPKE